MADSVSGVQRSPLTVWQVVMTVTIVVVVLVLVLAVAAVIVFVLFYYPWIISMEHP